MGKQKATSTFLSIDNKQGIQERVEYFAFIRTRGGRERGG